MSGHGHKPVARVEPAEIVGSFDAGNARFRKKVSAAAPTAFELNRAGQAPHTASVECSDSRVSVVQFTRMPFGRIFPIAKNAGNIVGPDKNTVASTTYALNHLPKSISLILVNGHYDCGGIKSLDEIGTGNLEREIESHLKRALPAKRIVDRLIAEGKLPADERHYAIVEANVMLQEKNLLDIHAVREAVGSKEIEIRGSVYNPFNGKLDWGYPVLEKHGVVEQVRGHFKELANRRRARTR